MSNICIKTIYNILLNLYFPLILIAGFNSVYAQTYPQLSWHVTLNEIEISPGRKIPYGTEGDSLRVNVLRFYISDITLFRNGILLTKDSIASHLIDFANRSSLTQHLPAEQEFDSIGFVLGVDSLLQEYGIGKADLDPVNGMYWTWQSGYIHFKLEGIYYPKFSSEKEITLHLGGYRTPHQTIQQLKFTCSPYHKNYLNLNLYPFINYALKSDALQIMSPCLKAVELSANLTQCIHPE
ncbi:MAG: MbnP family protein [Bacteroidota bacterium]|jgi:hypothetical protein